MKVQLNDYMAEALSSNQDMMRKTVNVAMDDQTERMTKRNDFFKASIMTLNDEAKVMMAKFEEFEGQLIVCKAVVGKGMLASISMQRKIDVLKPNEFKGMRFTNEKLAMVEAKSFVELGPRKGMFKTSKPKETRGDELDKATIRLGSFVFCQSQEGQREQEEASKVLLILWFA
ncbi:hypothetical protein J1N35_001541 [Gossypium stocksii]|uniref:Uncharacterized protein n=1 Tax=Gossypium stocksii TaxID=47602 RepID=A0A9D3WK43_9ROSI|nr:hypothetical protein J1N35_001541 [Gossypium stocksii]